MRCTSCGRDVSGFDDARFCPFCGGPLVAAVEGDGWVGRTIAGRFTIVAQLAEGGIGRVYVAEQPMGHTRRRLALKMLLPEHASNPEMVSRFFRECELVSLIEHPNVVRIYDFGEAEPGVFYIAMELVPGKSFAAVLRDEGPFDLADGTELLLQVCRGVAAAHDRGVVHRDLKPDNLMLLRQPGEPVLVKVLDFGIAKAVSGTMAGVGGVTRMGVIIGSPAYMSPEQFLGEGNDVRADIYSLGVVAYEMLTGARPFEAVEMTDWAVQHINAAPRPFEATPAGSRVPAAMRHTILRAMAKAKADRPTTVRELMAELKVAAQGDGNAPVQAGATIAVAPVVSEGAASRPLPPAPSSAAGRGARASPWRRAIGATAAVASIAAGAAFVVVLVGRSAPPLPPPPDVAPPATATAEVSATPAEHDATSASDAVERVEGVPPLPASPSEPSSHSAPPRVDTSACERALRATSCAEAQQDVHHCPDSAGKIHHLAHEHVAVLCGSHKHD
jgi:hypothetical protein